MRSFKKLATERRGAAALEFALVAGVFLPLCLGIFDAGLLLWTKGALQSTAALTARCAAIASPDCTDAPRFAVTTAENWIFPSIIHIRDVTVCISTVSYMQVTITCRFWAGSVLPPPLNNTTLTAVAYFPVAPAFPVAAAPC